MFSLDGIYAFYLGLKNPCLYLIRWLLFQPSPVIAHLYHHLCQYGLVRMLKGNPRAKRYLLIFLTTNSLCFLYLFSIVVWQASTLTNWSKGPNVWVWVLLACPISNSWLISSCGSLILPISRWKRFFLCLLNLHALESFLTCFLNLRRNQQTFWGIFLGTGQMIFNLVTPPIMWLQNVQ